jgi:propionyl-CoA carboxylase beta chain
MGPKGAVEIVFRKDVKGADDPERVIAEKEQEYKDNFANPYRAAEKGYIDDVIEPATSRFRIIRSLEMLATKQDSNLPRKHGNIPL